MRGIGWIWWCGFHSAGHLDGTDCWAAGIAGEDACDRFWTKMGVVDQEHVTLSDALAAASQWTDVTERPWEAARRLRDAIRYFLFDDEDALDFPESVADVDRLLDDEGIVQSLVRAVLGIGEFTDDKTGVVDTGEKT